MTKGIRVLVADDEESLRAVLFDTLTAEGYEVITAESGEEALKRFVENPFPVVVSDIHVGSMSGIELLKRVKQEGPDSQVVVITGFASVDRAISAMRAGAYDYLVKPFEDIDLIAPVVNRAAEKFLLLDQNRQLMVDLNRNKVELARVNGILSDMVNRDSLTGLFNHRFFQDSLDREMSLSIRHKRPLSLIFLDVDQFKRYNDNNGHLAGDQLLAIMSELLQKRLRKTDIIARYGGEEFVAILPETPKDNALGVAEDIRRSVAEYHFSGGDRQPLGMVTVSVGLSAYPEDGQNVATLIRMADDALFRVKEAGRNAVGS